MSGLEATFHNHISRSRGHSLQVPSKLLQCDCGKLHFKSFMEEEGDASSQHLMAHSLIFHAREDGNIKVLFPNEKLSQ